MIPNSRHKLLTCKLMVLNSANGDLVTERTFVDVLNMNVALGRVLVLLNNQVRIADNIAHYERLVLNYKRDIKHG